MDEPAHEAIYMTVPTPYPCLPTESLCTAEFFTKQLSLQTFRREQLVLRLQLRETHLLLSGASVGVPASRPIVQRFNHLAIKQVTCSFIRVRDMTVKLLGHQL